MLRSQWHLSFFTSYSLQHYNIPNTKILSLIILSLLSITFHEYLVPLDEKVGCKELVDKESQNKNK